MEFELSGGICCSGTWERREDNLEAYFKNETNIALSQGCSRKLSAVLRDSALYQWTQGCPRRLSIVPRDSALS